MRSHTALHALHILRARRGLPARGASPSLTVYQNKQSHIFLIIFKTRTFFNTDIMYGRPRLAAGARLREASCRHRLACLGSPLGGLASAQEAGPSSSWPAARPATRCYRRLSPGGFTAPVRCCLILLRVISQPNLADRALDSAVVRDCKGGANDCADPRQRDHPPAATAHQAGMRPRTNALCLSWTLDAAVPLSIAAPCNRSRLLLLFQWRTISRHEPTTLWT